MPYRDPVERLERSHSASEPAVSSPSSLLCRQERARRCVVSFCYRVQRYALSGRMPWQTSTSPRSPTANWRQRA